MQPRVNTAVRELLHIDDVSAAAPASTGGGGGGIGGGLHGQTVRDDGQRSGEVRYVGRPAAASPATGSPTIHAAETRALVNEALGLTKKTAWD